MLLQQFADRVVECLRESDTLPRRGGVEFTVLLPEKQCIDSICTIKKRPPEIFRRAKDSFIYDATSNVATSLLLLIPIHISIRFLHKLLKTFSVLGILPSE